jgi:hypothetical protein
MSTFYKHNDKKSGDGLAITDWNELSNAVAGNQGLHLALDATNKVGIGTDDPGAKLEVAGKVKATHFEGNGASLNNLNASKITSGKLAVDRLPSGIVLASGENATFTGNVGIGTTSPSAKLHISSGTSGDAILLLEADTDNNNESDNPMIQLRQDGGTYGVNIGFDQANFGVNKFGIGSRKYGNDYYDTFIINTENGNVGIGTRSPSDTLHVNGIFRQTYGGNTFRMWQNSKNLIFNLQKTNHGTNRIMGWDGDNNWDSYSDRRLKTNIEEEKNILKRLTELKVKNFNWKDDPNNKRKMIGFIAQDVQPFFPTLVKEHKDEETDEKTLTIPYANFGVLAVGAIKELNDKFESALEKLTKKVDALAKKLK